MEPYDPEDWSTVIDIHTTNRLHWSAPDAEGTRLLFFMSLYAGSVVYLPRPERIDTPWRAWVSLSYEGVELGWYATEAEAQRALAAEVHRAVNTPHPDR